MYKNIKIKYVAVVLLLMVYGSCADEDKQQFDDFQQGSIPLFAAGTNDTGFINYADFDATNIDFTVDKEGLADVESIDIKITYNNSETGEAEEVIASTVSSFPGAVTMTFDELLAAFEPEVVTADSLSLGDSFIIGGNMRMADGRYLDGGYSPSVFSKKPVTLTYNVACESDLAGDYKFTLVSGTNGEVATLNGQSIDQVAAGYYEISDISMDIFGPDFPIKYRFTDICGTLTPDVGSVDFGTVVNVQFNSGTTIDPVTGEITFSIEYIAPSCCGLEGIQTVFKATPQ